MNLKNMLILLKFILAFIYTDSSFIYAAGSIVVYNYSFYKINVVVTTQNATQGLANPPVFSYVQATLAPAPTNQDGTLQMHPTDINYPANSNVPLGTVSNVIFSDPAKNFDIQILDASGKVIKQINVGTTLGTVVDTDLSRAVYIYSNTNNKNVSLPNIGGAVYFWDSAHPLTNPSIQTFPPAIIGL
jgi:hypothetical protein